MAKLTIKQLEEKLSQSYSEHSRLQDLLTAEYGTSSKLKRVLTEKGESLELCERNLQQLYAKLNRSVELLDTLISMNHPDYDKPINIPGLYVENNQAVKVSVKSQHLRALLLIQDSLL